ncbi:coiled-coil domain-containing 6-like [Brachionus plicatilis]|uniref:Coiled-coil domain-containing 6-like n=1 Tax=Brachionus plicatilis TaxID=10195 RepID=A0A3M7PEY5_BRAPC|nr:coiled-coil domain-containing 6-like [Brachionus plicatilis]
MLTDSELESDTSSVHEANLASIPTSKEQLEKRIESLIQENRVLKIEIETFKIRVKQLQEENKDLRKASVNIQARAEQEEEYISNKLLKKIQSLKKEKELLANNYEREEEYLTNDLSRKLSQLRSEKVQLEQTLEQEQEHMVNKLMKKIEKLEAETSAKQSNLEQLRREKIELENTLEQEQESLVNRLWKRMERLEAEKRMLQEKLEQPVSAPLSPRNSGSASSLNHALIGLPSNCDQAANLTEHIINLRREVTRLKTNLEKAERDNKENMAKLVREEKLIKDENIRLQRRLQMEVDRREALCRHLSESESSLEMDDERHFNESTRQRTISSPIPAYVVHNPAHTNPAVQTQVFTQPAACTAERCPACNQLMKQSSHSVLQSPPHANQTGQRQSISGPASANPLTASSSLSSSSSSINSSRVPNQQMPPHQLYQEAKK